MALSIGGNDARFADVLADCDNPLKTGDCQNHTIGSDTQPLTTTEPAIIQNSVRGSIETTLKAIRAKAPNAKIVLMGYPQLLTTGTWLGMGGNLNNCTVGINSSERDWMVTQIDLMAGQMKLATQNVAAAVGGSVTFADARPTFGPKGACASPALINDEVITRTDGDPPLATDNPASAESFHPNPLGANTYATTFNTALRAIGS